jgi:hypothetical protein
MKICRGVFERCSSARITCVILEVEIVDDARQVIEARAVGTLDHVVLLAGPFELDVAANLIVDDATSPRAASSERTTPLRPSASNDAPELRRLGHPFTAVDERSLLGLGRLALLLHFVRPSHSRDTHGRSREVSSRPLDTAQAAAIESTSPCGPRLLLPSSVGPSSQSIPSQRKP